ncbi:MAG: type II toxin-antitoxin system RelE/ParE family toxin [Candidatus Thiodiazotropha endolucinida]
MLKRPPSVKPDQSGPNVLSFPHVSHVIYYILHEQQLVVFGVLHKRMVPVNHLVEREVT